MSYKFSTGSIRKGDIYYEDDREGEPTYIDFDQDTITLRPSGSQILHAQADAVGIGTTSPDYTLDVAGDIGVNQYIYHNGDSNTWINFTDNRIRLNAGGNNFIDCEDPGNAPHKVRINNGGNNIDFVIKDNSNNVYFTADASTSRIGIGTGTPDEALHVLGNIKIDGTEPNLQFSESGADRASISVNDSDNLVIHNQTINKHIVLKVNDAGQTREGLRLDGSIPEVVVNQQSDSLINFRVESDNSTHMLFVTGSDKVGIKTSTPIAELDVAGKIAITTEVQTPSQPADGQGYIYSKSDGKLYWRSHDLSETDLTATGGASSTTINMTHHRYNDGSGTGKEYIPWAGTSEQPSPSYISMGVAPYNGRLLKVLVRSSKSGGLGSTVVGIHIGTDGTTTFNTTAEEAITVNMAAANTTGTFSFTDSNHFAAGDTIAVSIDPTNAHGNVNVTCVWEYNIT